jgi:hypothetical protein
MSAGLPEGRGRNCTTADALPIYNHYRQSPIFAQEKNLLYIGGKLRKIH